MAEIPREQAQDIVDRSGLNLHAPIHISFGESKMRVEEERALGTAIIEAHCDELSGTIPESVYLTPRIANAQVSGTNYGFQDRPKRPGKGRSMEVQFLD